MDERLARHRTWFEGGNTRDPAARIDALKRLLGVMQRHENDLLQALEADLQKPEAEAYMMEIGFVYGELRDAMRHLRRWGRTRFKLPSIAQLPGHGRVLRDPYGVVLILAPWNYPVQLTLAPLVAAVAAGNCAVVRPSSSAPHTARVMATIIAESFQPGHVSCVLGDNAVAQALTEMPFDKIFFTGSPSVGRQVMAAASRNLVPVTLELGGKSPAIVAADADIKLAARRIAWGKFINAGQTCIAPDYVLVHHKVQNAFVEALRLEVLRQYGEAPLQSPDLTAIVNTRHYQRLSAMLQNGLVVCGGHGDPATRKIEPTVLTQVDEDDPLMQEEIFGPILPVLSFRSMEEAIASVRSRPSPLAFYLFTSYKDAAKRVTRDMAFGGGCINDTVLHVANPRMPFGGVGNSGMGAYHGRYGYECFSRPKGVFVGATRLDVPVRYPPYAGKIKLLKRIMK